MVKSIMIQGTTSNAGKSLITAGLCRILKQDGYKVAPFKSQNMALNSFITKDGLEMGRAQVMQAEAAGIEPNVCMNPILLKPTNDTGSQVILNGEVMGNMGAAEYYTHKQELIPHIMKAYETLAAQYDIIVLEGAGSPAEINLRDADIVNMGMAKLVDAPVLIAGDIDRGGVFASLAGTMMLLTEEERTRVKGLIVNKFRGDVNILKPGLDMLEDITKRPVAGVIPYMHLDVDDEDSLSERLEKKTVTNVIDIAIMRIPRLSNFTDFNALEYIPGVSLRYVQNPKELKNPDLIILPGTKNTMADLKWLRESGLEALIIRHASQGKPVFGVCGGYQMLGKSLSDPHGVEEGGQMAGIGLLPIDTIFEQQKTRTQVCGHLMRAEGIFSDLSGCEFEGYEIHMGISKPTEALEPFAQITSVSGKAESKADGYNKGNVYGTYIHGIFDREEVAKALVIGLCKAKGIDYDAVKAVDIKTYKDSQYDKLAQTMRENLDMQMIYDIIDKKR
ncbi:MAG: cobyric acid synthase [Anaerofustis sp.]